MMWLLRFTNYILRHHWQALLLTVVVTFIPIIGIIGIIIAAFVTICKGVREGALFTLAATLPYLISLYFSSGQGAEPISIAMWAAISVAVISNLLTFIYAVMLRKQTSWSVILQIAALTGVLAISVVHLAYPNIADWWGHQLQIYYTQAAKMTSGMLKPATPSIESQMEGINIAKQYATGLMVTGILFNALLQLVIARWWQSIVYRPGTLRRELHHIRLSRLAGLLFIVSLVLCYLGNSVVLDIMPVLYLLFVLVMLSLIFLVRFFLIRHDVVRISLN